MLALEAQNEAQSEAMLALQPAPAAHGQSRNTTRFIDRLDELTQTTELLLDGQLHDIAAFVESSIPSYSAESSAVDNKHCNRCNSKFSVMRWKHTCRHCRRVVCHACSHDRRKLGGANLQRVCNICRDSLTELEQLEQAEDELEQFYCDIVTVRTMLSSASTLLEQAEQCCTRSMHSSDGNSSDQQYWVTHVSRKEGVSGRSFDTMEEVLMYWKQIPYSHAAMLFSPAGCELRRYGMRGLSLLREKYRELSQLQLAEQLPSQQAQHDTKLFEGGIAEAWECLNTLSNTVKGMRDRLQFAQQTTQRIASWMLSECLEPQRDALRLRCSQLHCPQE